MEDPLALCCVVHRTAGYSHMESEGMVKGCQGAKCVTLPWAQSQISPQVRPWDEQTGFVRGPDPQFWCTIATIRISARSSEGGIWDDN